MFNNLVTIKGSNDGIVIYFDDKGKFEDIVIELKQKLNSAKQFFKGASVIGIKGKKIEGNQKRELDNILTTYGIKLVYNMEQKYDGIKMFEGIHEGETKIVKTTLRSGQNINYYGNVVVIGDVNPGAEIIAGGNIIVMGTLRGLAHAGATGNKDACIVAFSLQPKQMRIADFIGIAPDEDYISNYQEIAFIRDGVLVIEPYLTKK